MILWNQGVLLLIHKELSLKRTFIVTLEFKGMFKIEPRKKKSLKMRLTSKLENFLEQQHNSSRVKKTTLNWMILFWVYGLINRGLNWRAMREFISQRRSLGFGAFKMMCIILSRTNLRVSLCLPICSKIY